MERYRKEGGREEKRKVREKDGERKEGGEGRNEGEGRKEEGRGRETGRKQKWGRELAYLVQWCTLQCAHVLRRLLHY